MVPDSGGGTAGGGGGTSAAASGRTCSPLAFDEAVAFARWSAKYLLASSLADAFPAGELLARPDAPGLGLGSIDKDDRRDDEIHCVGFASEDERELEPLGTLE